MKLITVLALISLGVALPIFLMQPIDLQARMDGRQAHRALIARVGQ